MPDSTSRVLTFINVSFSDCLLTRQLLCVGDKAGFSPVGPQRQPRIVQSREVERPLVAGGMVTQAGLWLVVRGRLLVQTGRGECQIRTSMLCRGWNVPSPQPNYLGASLTPFPANSHFLLTSVCELPSAWPLGTSFGIY